MGVNLTLASTWAPTIASTGNNLNNNSHRTGPSNNNNNGCGAHKRKFGISDLPFTQWDIDSRKWHVSFVPSLLAWAGTQSDPFGTNSQMADEVSALWEHVYPAIVLNDLWTSIILSVVCTFPEPS